MTIQNYAHHRLKTKIIDEMHLLTIFSCIYLTKMYFLNTKF